MRDLRKVLVLATLFWGAPLSAEPRSETEQRTKQVCHQLRAYASGAHDGCAETWRGSTKSAGEKGGGVSFPLAEYPPAEIFLFDVGHRAPQYFP